MFYLKARAFGAFYFASNYLAGAGSIPPTPTAPDVDAVLTRKQLQALRAKLRQARKYRDAEHDQQNRYKAELAQLVERVVAGADEEQRDELVAALPTVADDGVPSAVLAQPSARIDWDTLVTERNRMARFAAVIQGLLADIAEMERRQRLEQDDEDIAILLMAMD